MTHSSYLRWLIAVLADVPLAMTTGLDQRNCCINVFDVPCGVNGEMDLAAKVLINRRIAK